MKQKTKATTSDCPERNTEHLYKFGPMRSLIEREISALPWTLHELIRAWLKQLAQRVYDTRLDNPTHAGGVEHAIIAAHVARLERLTEAPAPDALAEIRAIVREAERGLEDDRGTPSFREGRTAALRAIANVGRALLGAFEG